MTPSIHNVSQPHVAPTPGDMMTMSSKGTAHTQIDTHMHMIVLQKKILLNLIELTYLVTTFKRFSFLNSLVNLETQTLT